MIIKKKKIIQPEILEEDFAAQPPEQEENSGTVPDLSAEYAASAPAQEPVPEKEKDITEIEPDDIDLFNLDNIDFKQRQERRKGDRRRGFRRVDDRNLVSRAREEAASIREAASKEGYQAGLEKAREDVLELKNSLGVFLNSAQEVYEHIAPEILSVSVEIAKKIIKKEVSESPEVLINTVVEVLKGLSKEETRITLRVNPVQVDILRQSVPEILDLSGLDAKISVLADENISEGGCLVTTTNGVVDATIETQLAVVSEALRGV